MYAFTVAAYPIPHVIIRWRVLGRRLVAVGYSMLVLRRGEQGQSTHRSRVRFAHTRFHVAYPNVLSNNACECRLCISDAMVCGHAAMRSTLTSALVVLVLACTMLFRCIIGADSAARKDMLLRVG